MAILYLEALAAVAVSLAIRAAGNANDARYTAFAGERGVDSPQRTFILLQNQGLGSIPPVFANFVGARLPGDACGWHRLSCSGS
jgi:hypothetical protein